MILIDHSYVNHCTSIPLDSLIDLCICACFLVSLFVEEMYICYISKVSCACALRFHRFVPGQFVATIFI